MTVEVKPLVWLGMAKDHCYARFDGELSYTVTQDNPEPFPWSLKRGSILIGYYRDEEAARAAAQSDHETRIRSAIVHASSVAGTVEPVAKFTTGHCVEKAKPGGCQLHNLHCAYPDCDRKPAIIPAPEAAEDPRWQKLRDLFGLDGYHDGLWQGIANPDQIVTHIEYVASERARLLLESMKRDSAPSVAEAAGPVRNCPDCGRRKAFTATDAAQGLCPKWWAVRDEDAERDCTRHASAHPAPSVAEAAEPVAWQDVVAERERQKTVEGWTARHDDAHNQGEMAVAAGVYALIAGSDATSYRNARDGYSLNDYHQPIIDHLWPWDRSWFKPTERRRDLVKAGALILAEIERLDRAERGA